MAPTPSDAELAASRLTASALAVALGLRALEHAGQAKTVEALMRLTGYSQTQVYEARAVLKGRWPDKFPNNGQDSGHVPPDQGFSGEPESHSGQAELGIVPIRGGLRARASGVPDKPAPVWKRCLAERALDSSNGRSWDVYTDCYAPAWDAVLEATKDDPEPPYGDLIALTVHYIETVDGSALGDDKARGQVAKLVRSYGKAALYGWSQALGITDDDSTTRFRYARQVAERVAEETKGPR